MLKRFAFSALVASTLFVLPLTAAHAQANLSFSGGNGTPLTISLAAPVNYTINTAGSTSPFFIFDGATTGLQNGSAGFTGSISYTVNGGTPQSVTGFGSNYGGGDVTADDLFAFGTTSQALAVGSVVTLNHFSVTTTSNVAAPAPGSKDYTTFIVNSGASRISANGITAAVVPEANTAALLGLALPMIGAVVVARRKK